MTHDPQAVAEACVGQMLQNDAFTAWLGARLVSLAPGRCVLEMTVRHEMTNGFALCHGGVTFAFADSALAFACNTRGKVTVSIELNIQYPQPVHEGDRLTATAEERVGGARISCYDVVVTNQRDEVVALFRGTVYTTQKEHLSHA